MYVRYLYITYAERSVSSHRGEEYFLTSVLSPYSSVLAVMTRPTIKHHHCLDFPTPTHSTVIMTSSAPQEPTIVFHTTTGMMAQLGAWLSQSHPSPLTSVLGLSKPAETTGIRPCVELTLWELATRLDNQLRRRFEESYPLNDRHKRFNDWFEQRYENGKSIVRSVCVDPNVVIIQLQRRHSLSTVKTCSC